MGRFPVSAGFPPTGGLSSASVYMPNTLHSGLIPSGLGTGHSGVPVPGYAALTAAQQLHPPTVIVTQQGAAPIAMTSTGGLPGLPVAGPSQPLSHGQMMQQMQHLHYLQHIKQQQQQQPTLDQQIHEELPDQQEQQGGWPQQQEPPPREPTPPGEQSKVASPAPPPVKPQAKLAKPAEKAAPRSGPTGANGNPSLATVKVEAPHLYKQQKESVSLLEAAKRSLPVAFREDGPPLGFDFDDVPGLCPRALQRITGQCQPTNLPNLRDSRRLACIAEEGHLFCLSSDCQSDGAA